VLVKAGFAQSRREAERLIAGNAVKIDGELAKDPKQLWTVTGAAVLSVGSRRFIRVLPAMSS
jgi:tyrosyl-tRNA synthetase